METETREIKHFKKGGIVISARCRSERSSKTKAEKYLFIGWSDKEGIGDHVDFEHTQDDSKTCSKDQG